MIRQFVSFSLIPNFTIIDQKPINWLCKFNDKTPKSFIISCIILWLKEIIFIVANASSISMSILTKVRRRTINWGTS